MKHVFYFLGLDQFVHIRQTPARYIALFASRVGTLSFLELVVMRVMNAPSLNFHRIPIKGGVTIGTPHLCTTTNLENHRTTFGTRFGIFLDQIDRFDVTRITSMLTLALIYLIAVLANIILTNLTLPPRRQKPLAFINRALSNKFSLFSRLWLKSFSLVKLQKKLQKFI